SLAPWSAWARSWRSFCTSASRSLASGVHHHTTTPAPTANTAPKATKRPAMPSQSSPVGPLRVSDLVTVPADMLLPPHGRPRLLPIGLRAGPCFHPLPKLL